MALGGYSALQKQARNGGTGARLPHSIESAGSCAGGCSYKLGGSAFCDSENISRSSAYIFLFFYLWFCILPSLAIFIFLFISVKLSSNSVFPHELVNLFWSPTRVVYPH